MRLFRFLKTKMREDRNRARGYGRGQPSKALDTLRRIGVQQVRQNQITKFKINIGRTERTSSTSRGQVPPKLKEKSCRSFSRRQVSNI